MKAALGAVSAGGIGTPESDVTHNGGGPWTFVAIQSGGSAGGVTLSKFSIIVFRHQQGKHGGGLGSSAARLSTRSNRCSGEEANPPSRWAMMREEPITANVAIPAATKRSEQAILRKRVVVNICLRPVISRWHSLTPALVEDAALGEV
jgi:hypothetical protein